MAESSAGVQDISDRVVMGRLLAFFAGPQAVSCGKEEPRGEREEKRRRKQLLYFGYPLSNLVARMG